MITVEDAHDLIESCLHQRGVSTDLGWCPTRKAAGRILAEDVRVAFDSPPYDQSAMDGYALAFGSYREVMPCIGTVAAGDQLDQLHPGPGECVQIMTGAPMPAKTDTVVMVEKTERNEEKVKFLDSPRRGQHVRRRASNAHRGQLLVAAGTPCRPNVIAALLAQGIWRVRVRAPLSIGVAASGQEIVPFFQPCRPGQILNSNGPALMVTLGAGQVVEDLGIFPDRLDETTRLLSHYADRDLIVLSGGVSMGEFDFVPEAARAAGFRCVFHKVSMKPGKPIWFGVHESGCLMFGLPGNPVSAMVAAELFVLPLIRGIQTGDYRRPGWSRARLGLDLENSGSRTLFVGVRRQADWIEPVPMTGSGDVIGFAAAETLARLQPHSKAVRGDWVDVLAACSLQT